MGDRRPRLERRSGQSFANTLCSYSSGWSDPEFAEIYAGMTMRGQIQTPTGTPRFIVMNHFGYWGPIQKESAQRRCAKSR